MRLTLENKHWIAPIEDPRSIIDIGTGTGIWCMDVADDFPGSTVMGIDLSPIQPTLVPPNLEFIVQDLEESWDMPNRFDFVHTRCMNGFSVKSWPTFYENAFISLKAGGWVSALFQRVIVNANLDFPGRESGI
jgi:trans-aconitate methyltransferase